MASSRDRCPAGGILIARSDAKAVRKYLDRHAEVAARLGAGVDRTYARVVVIPAFGEGPILDRALASVPRGDGGPALAVVVINEREDSPPSITAINDATFMRLSARYARRSRLSDDAALCQAPFGDLALLRVTLARDQGVGLARKHGADFALGAWAAGRLASPWIHCTDADVLLPQNYFLPPRAPAAAALHPFRHEVAEPGTQAYVRSYDLWLRLHVLGLHFAGSPYAFHTIGSTITVDARSYAAVRGFPRRNAAEDFYFLNKLAKLGPIVIAPSAPLRIAARASDRVPFGTGRAIGRMQRDGAHALPRFFDPTIYLYLKTLLEGLERAVVTGAFEPASLRQPLRERGLAAAPMDVAIEALGLQAPVRRLLRSSAHESRRRRAVHGWFDAFRTMKLIHQLRDNGIACVDLRTAVNAGGFLLRQTAPAARDDVRVVRSLLTRASPGCHRRPRDDRAPPAGR